MNSLILKLRELNLKWAVFISIAVSLAVGIISINSDKNLCFAGIFTVVASAILYITLAVHAIEKDEKAILVSYLVIVAYTISAIMTFNVFKDTPDLKTAITEEIYNFRNPVESLEAFATSTVINNAPYSFLMNVIMLVAWSIGLKHIRKQYIMSWITGLAGNIILILGNSFVLTDGTLGYDIYKTCNNIGMAISAIFLISVLCIKDSKKEFHERENDVSNILHPQNIAETKTKLSLSEQLFRLKELLDCGILTQEEFDTEKKKILNS